MRKLLGVLFVVGCLASISGCRTSKQGYVAKGNRSFDAGKYSEAAINYRKAIQKDEHYGEAFYRLGLAEIKEQNSREAFDALYRAVQLLPTNFDAKEQLGSLSLEYYLIDPHRSQFYYNTVKQISDQLLQRNPKSFEGLREKAYLAMTDEKREESIALFRKALEVNPSDPIVTTALIQNLILTGQGKEAERLGLDLIARQKVYAPVYSVMYEWYMKENRQADAENMLKTRVSNNPKQGGSLLELASHYARMQKPAEMQATLQRLLDDPKDFPQARMWLGDFYYRRRNYPEAVRYFEEGTRTAQGTDKVLYQKRATDALLMAGKGVQASSTVDQIVQENPKDTEARHVQANLMLRSGNPQKIDAAERELKDLSAEQPNDASVWLGLGRAEELRGNLDTARARYLEALNKNGNYLQARYALAEIGLIQKRPEETLQQANEILKVRPDDPRARLLRAQALARTGNAATARIELTRIKDFQHNPQAQIELGLLALSENKFQEAVQVFGKLRETGEPQAIAGLAKAYASQKQFDRALEVLNEGLRKSNNSPLLLSQLGSTQALAGKYDAAIVTLQKLIALRPKSAQDRLQLADVFTLQGDNNSALAKYREAAQLAPADMDTGLELARALSRAARIDEARAQYQTVLTAHPDDALALNDMAFFIWENGGNLDQALGFAQRALQRVPGQPSYSDTIGCIYLKKGLSDSALQVFNNLVKKYPNYSTFRYHLGMALLEKGDKKSAKRELETALAAHPSRQDEARIKELLGKIS
jgi:tetratricopeptide (TPR) repeat protein